MFIVRIVEILRTKATRGAPRSNELVELPRFYEIKVHRVYGDWFQPALHEDQIKGWA